MTSHDSSGPPFRTLTLAARHSGEVEQDSGQDLRELSPCAPILTTPSMIPKLSVG